MPSLKYIAADNLVVFNDTRICVISAVGCSFMICGHRGNFISSREGIFTSTLPQSG